MGLVRTIASRLGPVAQAALAAVCVVSLGAIGYREYERRRCIVLSTEAVSTLQSIRVAEEAARAEYEQYLGCDADGVHFGVHLLPVLPLFPREEAQLDGRAVPWAPRRTEFGRCWAILDVRADGPVRFGYAVAANGLRGNEGREQIFEARAVGDRDDDGDLVEYRISSRANVLVAIDEDD